MSQAKRDAIETIKAHLALAETDGWVCFIHRGADTQADVIARLRSELGRAEAAGQK